MNHRLLTRETFSKLLLAWAEEQISSKEMGLPVSDRQVADYLGLSRSTIQKVRGENNPFGKASVPKFTAKLGWSITELHNHLLNWALKRGMIDVENQTPTSLPFDVEPRPEKPKKSNEAVNELRHRAAGLTRCVSLRLKRELRAASEEGDLPTHRFDGDRAYRYVLSSMAEVFAELLPDVLRRSLLVFSTSEKRVGDEEVEYPYALAAQWDGESWVNELHSADSVSGAMRIAIQSCWNGSSSPAEQFKSFGMSVAMDEDMRTPCHPRINDGDDLQCILLPVHRHCLPLRNSVVAETCSFVTLCAFMSTERLDRSKRLFVEELLERFSELLEYVSLSVVQDVVAASAFTNRDLALATQRLWTSGLRYDRVPTFEKIEVRLDEFLSDLCRQPNDKLASLLAVDIWLFDSWSGRFVSKADWSLHCTTDFAERFEVSCPRALGERQTYATFYKNNLSALNPRRHGQSAHAVAHHHPVLVDKAVANGDLTTEAFALHQGTDLGIPLDVVLSPDGVYGSQPAMLWMRFGDQLDSKAASTAIQNTMKSMKKTKCIIPRIRVDAQNTTVGQITAAVKQGKTFESWS